MIDFTDDVQQLVNAILAIERGGSSTDLNGAIVQGMNALSNTYTFEKITVGAMVMITDGNDTASRSTEAAAIDAVREKLLFAVPVDAEATATANLASLEQITNGTRTTGTGRVISANDFAADLVRALGSASASLDGLADGVFFCSTQRQNAVVVTSLRLRLPTM